MRYTTRIHDIRDASMDDSQLCCLKGGKWNIKPTLNQLVVRNSSELRAYCTSYVEDCTARSEV